MAVFMVPGSKVLWPEVLLVTFMREGVTAKRPSLMGGQK